MFRFDRILYLFIGVALALTSCSPIYIPCKHQVFTIKEKGDVNIDLALGYNNFDVQALPFLPGEAFYKTPMTFINPSTSSQVNWDTSGQQIACFTKQLE